MKKKILIFMSCLLATCYVNAQTNERISRAEDITTGWYRVKCTVAASSEAAYVGCYWLNAEKEFEQNAPIGKPLDNMLGSHWGHFSFSFIIVLYSVAVYPLVIRMMTERREKTAGN